MSRGRHYILQAPDQNVDFNRAIEWWPYIIILLILNQSHIVYEHKTSLHDHTIIIINISYVDEIWNNNNNRIMYYTEMTKRKYHIAFVP